MQIVVNKTRVSEVEKREQAIYDLIEAHTIGKQTQLVNALVERGFDVTQATVSRDVRRLGLVKKPLPGGGYRYSRPGGKSDPTPRPVKASSYVTSIFGVEAVLAINTLPGRATAVAVTIDEAEMPEIAGTLAGDNFLLVAVKNAKDRDKVQAALKELV